MTDRAKKISELQATTTVANTDKLVVLKDPSGTPLTRSVTANLFALSIGPIARMDITGATLSKNSVSIASSGTSNVEFLTVANSKMYALTYTATDIGDGDYSMGCIYVTANNTQANAYTSFASSIGGNQILVNVSPSVNAGANTTSVYFTRQSSSTTNVTINYQLTKYS